VSTNRGAGKLPILFHVTRRIVSISPYGLRFLNPTKILKFCKFCPEV